MPTSKKKGDNAVWGGKEGSTMVGERKALATPEHGA